METLPYIVAKANSELAALEESRTANPDGIRYPEMVQYHISQLLSILITPYATVPVINFPRINPELDRRSFFPASLDTLRGNLPEKMGVNSPDISAGISAALTAFYEFLRKHPDANILENKKSKYAHSYLDALVGLIEEQAGITGTTAYTPTRERIQRSFANGILESGPVESWWEAEALLPTDGLPIQIPAAISQSTEIRFIDSRILRVQRLNEWSEIKIFLQELTQGTIILPPSMRASGPLLTWKVRINDQETLTLMDFVDRMVHDRGFTMHRLRSLDLEIRNGRNGEWARVYTRPTTTTPITAVASSWRRVDGTWINIGRRH